MYVYRYLPKRKMLSYKDIVNDSPVCTLSTYKIFLSYRESDSMIETYAIYNLLFQIGIPF